MTDQKRSPEVVLLGYADEIEGLIHRTQGHILEETESLGVGEEWSEAVYRRDAELLRRRVWEPIAARLGDLDRVFIVPDEALHLINFAALPSGAGGKRYQFPIRGPSRRDVVTRAIRESHQVTAVDFHDVNFPATCAIGLKKNTLPVGRRAGIGTDDVCQPLRCLIQRLLSLDN